MIDIVYRFDPLHPVVHPEPGDASEARLRLERGNRDFAASPLTTHLLTGT